MCATINHMNPAFYNPNESYEKNYTDGPPISSTNQIPNERQASKKQHSFLGFPVSLPFGIPSGPLLNAEYIKAAFAWGFDVSTYKSVRTDTYPSHPFPNVLSVTVQGDLHPDKTPKLIATNSYSSDPTTFSITNSFGVPSKSPSEWQEDVSKALSYQTDGKLLIVSFMGTVKESQTQEEFIKDFSDAALLAKQTGASVLEANLSCPNIGNEGLVCYNLEVTRAICKAIRSVIGNTPLILKVGYFSNQSDLLKIAEIANEYGQAVAAINTLQVEIVDENGEQALPGKNRQKSGVCGASIKWAGLEMTKRLNALRKEHGYTYEILGIGGVMTKEDYKEYRNAGADCVQSATGAMWNPNLADEIWKEENL